MNCNTAKCPELARQQKREANARHRARKKAQQAQTEWALTATAAELERERGRTVELLQEQDALHRMSAYQAEAAQLLDFAALAEQLEGELTLYPAGTGYAAVAAPAGLAAAVNSGQQSMPAAPAASTAAAASSGPEAAAAVSSGSSGNALAAALAAFGCSGLDQGAAAAVAAAASDDSVDLDAALAELDDADLALLVQQVQDGSGGDWLDDLQNWLEEPVPTLPTQPAQQPMQVAQPTQAPLQAAQVPQSQQQPQQQPVSKRRQQVEAEEALLRELTREPPLPVRWDQYPLQPPSWLLRVACRAMQLSPISVLELSARRFLQKLENSMQQWEACPGSRRQIEHLIAARMADRQYCLQQLVQHRPADLLAVWSKFACPAPPAGTTFPDGRPAMHSALLPAAQYMEANLSAHQLSQVHQAWQRFVQGSQAAQQRRAQSTAVLHQAAAQQCISWQKQSTKPSGGCTAERAEAFCSMAESTGGLAVEPVDLATRLLDLQGALLRALTTIQMARVLLASSPFFPDLAQIGPWLFARGTAATATLGGGPTPNSSLGASGVGRSAAAGAGTTPAGTDSDSARDAATDALLPVGFADVLLEERMQAIQEHPVHKLSGGEVRTASCHSGGSGHDPAHLFAAAVSMGMPGW
ncbi:hypothetical protein COHA_004861 [Chlorella ohadii]|uniref:BZIP domain-containing protein n=1 Tax=Chlorella ohadii TaxID=2649997 RepID=A0AAD5DQX3_9CHLO|nr:hypothetical protein COHA_004861 [Chlorella ohadii]